jgi:opine dehydrogenase
MLHVANCVANAGRIESGERYRFYAEGVTPAVARLYQAINAERVAVAAAVGASVPTLADWFERVYGVRGATLVETCQQLTYNSDGPYQATGTPKSLDHKFITEDVPTSLIPMSALGAEAGTTPANHEMVSSSAILFPFTSARAVTTPAALYWRSRAHPPTEHPPWPIRPGTCLAEVLQAQEMAR